MTWFASKRKTASQLDQLLDRLRRLSARIADYEEQDALSARLGMPSNGQVAQTRDAHSHISDTLLEAREGLISGELDFKEVHPQLPSVSKAISHMEWILDEADKDVARAKLAFKLRFGSPSQ